MTGNGENRQLIRRLLDTFQDEALGYGRFQTFLQPVLTVAKILAGLNISECDFRHKNGWDKDREAYQFSIYKLPKGIEISEVNEFKVDYRDQSMQPSAINFYCQAVNDGTMIIHRSDGLPSKHAFYHSVIVYPTKEAETEMLQCMRRDIASWADGWLADANEHTQNIITKCIRNPNRIQLGSMPAGLPAPQEGEGTHLRYPEGPRGY